MVERFEWSTSKGRLGVMVMSLTPELRKHFGVPDDRGVLVAHVDPGTPAAKAGIEVGDVIVEVRGRKIETAPDVLSALADLGKGDRATIEIVRERTSRSLQATLADAAAPATSWSPPWPRDWVTPFDGPTWSRDWLTPLDQTKHEMKHETDPAGAFSWLRTLHDLFDAKHTPPACTHS